jgi:hypothetical protein
VLRAAQRPGDRHASLPLNEIAADVLRAVCQQAAAAGIPAELALSLALQRVLVESDLRGSLGDRADATIAALDREAASAHVEGAVSDEYAAYVRALSTAAPYRTLAGTAPMPVRVLERLDAGELPRLIDAGRVPSALAWERAAAISGRTMAEWAAFAALNELASAN